VNRTSSRNGHPSQLTGSEEMSNLVRTSTGPPFNSEPRKRFHSEYFHYDHTSKTSRFPLENGHFSSKIWSFPRENWTWDRGRVLVSNKNFWEWGDESSRDNERILSENKGILSLVKYSKHAGVSIERKGFSLGNMNRSVECWVSPLDQTKRNPSPSAQNSWHSQSRHAP